MNKTRQAFSLTAMLTLLVVIVAVTAWVTGCAGNNPSGPSGGTPTGTTAATAPTDGTGSISGALSRADTGVPLTDAEAAAIRLRLYLGTDLIAEQTPLGSGLYAFNNLKNGFYYLAISDTSGTFNGALLSFDLTQGGLKQENFQLKQVFAGPPAPGTPAPFSTHIFGQYLAYPSNEAIAFAKVSIGSNEVTTLGDGSFILLNVPQGTFEMKFSKGGNFLLNKEIRIATDGVTFGSGNLTPIAINPANVNLPLAPADLAFEIATDSKLIAAGDNLANLGVVYPVPDLVTVGRITGRVVTPANVPVPGSRFSFRLMYRRLLEATSEVQVFRSQVTPDENGYFALENLPAGFFYAVGPDAKIVTFPVTNGLAYEIQGTVYASAIQVVLGKTSIMEIYINDDPVTLSAPTNLFLTRDVASNPYPFPIFAGVPNGSQTVSIPENAFNIATFTFTRADEPYLQWEWQNATISSSLTSAFEIVLKHVTKDGLKTYTKAIDVRPMTAPVNVAGGQVATFSTRFNFSDFDVTSIGNYHLQILVRDPFSTLTKTSTAKLFQVRPGKYEVSPQHGTNISFAPPHEFRDGFHHLSSG